MNKTITLICLAVVFFAASTKVNSQAVAEEQRLLITKRTASWCPNCGTWGWTLFKNLIADNGEKAVLMAAHYDGQLAVPAAADLTDNFGGFYQPRFFVNETDVNASSGNISSIRSSVEDQAAAAFSSSPVVNSGFAPVWQDGVLKVDAKVKFFQQAQGEFYLGIYLLENNVNAYQAGIGNGAVHQKLFRAAFGPETWGQLVVDGPVSGGQEFGLSFSHPLDELQGDYEVAGVVWKKVDDKYLPVNAWSTDQIGTATAAGSLVESGGLKISAVPSSGRVTVSVSHAGGLEHAVLDVVEVSSGRVVLELHRGRLDAGAGQVWETSRDELGRAGVYLIRMRAAGKQHTEPVVVH